ncbi:MAG: DUF1697 domain-containing protein [Actinobacteria bacterium]|nr:DUF1697 domain-containing protein [Actinomycetota bacterium]
MTARYVALLRGINVGGRTKVRRAVGTAVNEEGTRLRTASFAANQVPARFEVALELADQSDNLVTDLVAVLPALEADVAVRRLQRQFA